MTGSISDASRIEANEVKPPLPCLSCVKAETTASGDKVMCRRVANVVLEHLNRMHYMELNIGEDRLEGIIAEQHLGLAGATAAAINACTYMPPGRKPEEIGLLEQINC